MSAKKPSTLIIHALKKATLKDGTVHTPCAKVTELPASIYFAYFTQVIFSSLTESQSLQCCKSFDQIMISTLVRHS